MLAMMEMLTIHVIRCCVHCRSIENEYPLCVQGRGERGGAALLIVAHGLSLLSLSLSCTSPAQL